MKAARLREGFSILGLGFLLLFSFEVLASSGITYQGRLLDPSGVPVTSSNVQFKMQIRTPGTQDCLLYEEIQTVDLSMTSGVFALSVGDGTGTRTDAHTSDWNLFEALSNRKDFSFSAGECSAGSSYSPDPTDNRRFRVFFDLGSGWESLPTQTINYIPMSIESYAVGGFPASSLLRVEDSGSLVNTSPLSNAQYTELLNLLSGTSSQYEQSGELNGSALPSLTSGQTMVSDGSGGWSAMTPLTSESDPNVSAFAKTSLPTCGTGEVLKADGTTLTCVTDTGGWTATDATTTTKGIVSVPSAGGLEVTSGAIGLPDQTLTPGQFTKVTVNQKGIVTSGATLSESDIPQLTSSGNGVDGGAITTGTIGGSTAMNTSGNIQTSGAVSSGSFSTRQFDLYDSDNTNKISFLAPATGSLTTDYTLTFPSALGTSNQLLGMNNAGDALENKSLTAGSGVTITHSAGGITISATGSGGTVTGVTGTAPISVNNTDAANPVVTLSNSGVGAGTYGSATEVPVFTVDATGRVTGVTDTTISGVSPVGATLNSGQVWIGDGTNKAVAGNFGISNLKTSLGAQQWPTTSCTTAQTLTWTSITDALTCSNISITKSQVSDFPTLGTAAAEDVGTAAGDVVQLDGSGKIPTSLLPNGVSTQWTTTGSNIYYNTGNVGIGTTSPDTQFVVAGDLSGGVPGHAVKFRIPAYTYTDNVTAGSGTAPVFFSANVSQPVLAATSSSVTTTSASNFYVNGAVTAGTNQTIDESYAIKVPGITVSGVNNAYGISVSAPVGATNNYAAVFPSGNVGIGTTTPTAELEVVGTIKATGFEGPLTSTSTSIGDGSSTSPSMTFTNDSNTGFYSSGADTIGVSAGGNKVWDITTSSIVSPTAGGALVSSSAGSASSPTFSFSGDADTGWFSPATNTLAASTAGTERIRITASGSIGVGTTNPLGKFSVEGGDIYLDKDSNSNGGFITEANLNGIGLVGNASRLAAPDLYVNEAGNVGIGTVSPLEALDVNGAINVRGNGGTLFKFSGETTSAGAPVSDGAIARYEGTLFGAAEDGLLFEKTDFNANSPDGGILFANRGMDGVRVPTLAIRGTGNVGIGTTNPSEKLTITDGSLLLEQTSTTVPILKINALAAGTMPSIRVYNPDNTTNPYSWLAMRDGSLLTVEGSAADGSMGTAYFIIKEDGKTGIGTSSPGATLSIRDTTPSTTAQVKGLEIFRDMGGDIDTNRQSLSIDLKMTDSNYSNMSQIRSESGWDATSDSSSSAGESMSQLVFATSDTGGVLQDRMVITGRGNIGIGTSTPTNRITIMNGGIDIDTDGAGDWAGIWEYNGGLTLSGGMQSVNRQDMHISAGGNVGIGTTAPAQKLDVYGNIAVSGTTVHSSDRRLKEEIEPLTDSLDKIMTLSGYHYYWKDRKVSQRQQVGVIAQEVKEVFPELVYQNTQSGYYSVNYEGLIPPLIESAKELYGMCKMDQDQLQRLTAQVQQNQRDIASLKEENLKKDLRIQQLERENAAIRSYLCSKDPQSSLCDQE